MDSSIASPIAEIDLAVSGMTCASCVARVEKKLNKHDGIDAVVNLATEQAHIQLTEDFTNDALIEIVTKAGYGASVIRRIDVDSDGTRRASDIDAEHVMALAEDAARARVADLWRRFLVSAVLTIPVVALSMIPTWQFTGWQWLVSVLSLPVAFWCGWPFHREAFRALRYGNTTMNTLVSLGVLTAMGWSLWALFFGGAGHAGYTMKMTGIARLAHAAHPHLYFESAAMIVTFLLIGRWLEARSRHSAGDALHALLDLGADSAELVTRADGTMVNATVPVADLQVGDIFRVKPGQTIATDGTVVDGHSAIDASLVTGESVPVEVAVGDAVVGATLNTHGSLLVRADRVGEETTLAQMGRLLTEAQTGKAPVQRLADKISAVFVPTVIGIALLTFLARMVIFDNPFQMALASAITVLVVACPCALGLATPTALLVGSGRLASSGALIGGPQVLESACDIDVMIMDKTGTLTSGLMSVSDVVGPASVTEILQAAAGLEVHSEHPIARAIVTAAHKHGVSPRHVTDFRAIPGSGIRGLDGDYLLRAGTLSWLESEGVDVSSVTKLVSDLAKAGASTVVVAEQNVALGVIAIRDSLREDAREAVTQIRKLGIEPVMATGDNAVSAHAIASELGITEVHAQVSPDGKLDIVTAYHDAGKRVAMVGDGVNDAAALARADLSIAMGSGTDVAKASADITVMNADLSTVGLAITTARKTLRVIKENLAWAFGYNLIAIPLAILGVIVPGIAAAAMAFSSVIVVVNSLKLRA